MLQQYSVSAGTISSVCDGAVDIILSNKIFGVNVNKFITTFLITIAAVLAVNFTGCAQIQSGFEKITGNKIEQLRGQVDDVRALLDTVMSSEELAAIRQDIRGLNDIDVNRLGTDDSKLWIIYGRIRSVVQRHYATLGEPIPAVFVRFNRTAEKIHERLPTVVKTAQDARRLIAIYRMLVA